MPEVVRHYTFGCVGVSLFLGNVTTGYRPEEKMSVN